MTRQLFQIGMDTGIVDIVYSESNDKLYGLLAATSGIVVVEIDPDNLAVSTVINDPRFSGAQLPSITTDDTYLYIITMTVPAEILKYDLSDFTLVSNNILVGYNNGHAIIYGGLDVYATGGTGGGSWLAKINTLDLSYNVMAFQDGASPTDDFAELGEYVYVCSENRGEIRRFSKNDLSYIQVFSGVGSACYEVFSDGKYIWGVMKGNTNSGEHGILVRLDPTTLESKIYEFDVGEDKANEIETDGRRFYVSFFLVPSKISRINIPEFGDSCSLNTTFDAQEGAHLLEVFVRDIGGNVDSETINFEVLSCVSGQTKLCGSNIGECVVGYESCVNGAWDGVCVGEVAPTVEVCDGVADDDCDGFVDEEDTDCVIICNTDADTDCDGCVSDGELEGYLDGFIFGQRDLSEASETIVAYLENPNCG